MIDILGTLYTPGTYDADMEIITPAVALPGYHVNTPIAIMEWEAFRVEPNAPRRVFGGHVTYFYSFADEAEFLAQRTAAGLDPVEA